MVTKDIAIDALLALRHRILSKGWRMSDADWRIVESVDAQLKEIRANPDDVIDEGRAVVQNRYGVTPS